MPEIYQIRVKGHLDSQWSAWFDGMTITNQPNGEALLAGPVTDQSALHGLLIKIRDLGLPLLAITQAPDRSDVPGDSGAGKPPKS
jgi:hypothetical protein